MHVLITAHDFYPDPGSGGTGRYVFETARRFVDRGHRTSVITRRRGDVPRFETIRGIDVYRYDISIAGESATDILPQLPAAYRTVAHYVARAAAEPIDLLSFQGPVTSFLVDLAADGSIPRTCTFHSPWPTEYAIKTRDDSSLSPLRRRANVRLRAAVERRVVENADRIVTLSEFMRGELDRVYGPTTETTVVPGGVDVERFSPDAGRYDRIDADGTAFLTVRRLSERMGHRPLLDAFARIAEEFPDAHLYVAGDGPLRDDLERRAARNGIGGRVTFLGYVPDEDLPSAYATADVFVLPTTELEGFGLATLEALASGTPAVGTPVGGTVEVLGPLAESGDLPADPLVEGTAADELAAGLSAWADLSEDRTAAAGAACRRYARDRYSWEAVADELVDEYRTVIDRRERRRGSALAGRSTSG
ncbi:glycosyltransferase family 4 protein [Halegenticoccus soli]|uniref:glycosyltransferase family 4 protein n=1 Tax=Halegenticoccus soli TaxID=1985678 RepID=UPI0013041AFF|nr:glycosyltransferase family 4 protein [Halegenticoccus soli]